MRLSNFVEYVEKAFGNLVSVIDAKFRVDEVIGKATGYVSATILGQAFEFALSYFPPKEWQENGEWVLSGFWRVSDKLSVFRAADIFAAIPKNERGRPKLFLRFRLVEYNGELVLAVFSDDVLRHAFYIKDMVPQSAETQVFNKIHFHKNTGEFQLPGENLNNRIALKETIAVFLKRDFELSDFEKTYQQLKRRSAAKAAEVERQRKLAEKEAERLRRNKERERRRDELLARPRISVYRGELVFSALPITSEEYAGGVHLVLSDETGLVVVKEFDLTTGTAFGPVKVFVHRKDASGRTKEGRTLTEISLERSKRDDQTVVVVSEIIFVDNNGEPMMVFVLDDAQYEALRRRGTNHGTHFVRKGKREKDGRWSVFQFADKEIKTRGLMTEM